MECGENAVIAVIKAFASGDPVMDNIRSPLPKFVGEPLLDICEGKTFPLSKMYLPQVLPDKNRDVLIKDNDLRCSARTGKIAAVCCCNMCALKLPLQTMSLLYPRLIKRKIEMTDITPLVIGQLYFAVSYEINRPCLRHRLTP